MIRSGPPNRWQDGQDVSDTKDMPNSISIPGLPTALLALRRNQEAVDASVLRLASGRRINRGSDDPAGLINAQQLEAELAALEAESRGLQRSVANANIIDGQASVLSSLLVELNGLVVASANTGGLSDAELAANQTQIDSIVSSIGQLTGQTLGDLQNLNLPDNGNAALADALSAAASGVATIATGGANQLSGGDPSAAQTVVQDALSAVASLRGTIGGFVKYSIEPRLDSIAKSSANLLDSKSRISDTDFAVETTLLARAQVLTEASLRALKIAQQQSGALLKLLD